MTVLCYGDSNTYGFRPGTDGDRYDKEIRWTTILEEKLGPEYDVIVEGLNGRTTAYDRPDGAFKNGFFYLKPCIGSHKPVDILVFMLGTNDCNADLFLSIEDIAKGMEKLIIEAKESSLELQGFEPKIILIVPAAIRDEIEGTPFFGQIDHESVKKSRMIAPLYEKLALKYGCEFIDASDKCEVTKIDCEHLTETGHKQLAELIYDKIRELKIKE